MTSEKPDAQESIRVRLLIPGIKEFVGEFKSKDHLEEYRHHFTIMGGTNTVNDITLTPRVTVDELLDPNRKPDQIRD